MDYDFKKLIIQAQNGERDAFENILIYNKNLVYSIANRLWHEYNKYEDINQVGIIGLIKAIRTYDSNRNTKFSTYATRCIRNEMLMFLRKERKTHNEVSLENEIYINKYGERVLFKDIIDDEDSTSDIDLCLDLKMAMSKLKQRQREIIDLLFFKNMSENEVADLYNLSRQRINQIKFTTLAKMKQQLTLK